MFIGTILILTVLAHHNTPCQGRPMVLEAAVEMFRMIGGEVQKYPEGQELVRDILGAIAPSTSSRTKAEPTSVPITPAPAPDSALTPARPSTVAGRDPILPTKVQINKSEGHLTLQPVGAVFRSPQAGYLRIKVDISSLHRQLQEVHHHLHQNGYPTIQNSDSGDSCLSEGEGKFISLHQALVTGHGGPITGKLNDTHSGPHLQGDDLQENCTLKSSDLTFLSGEFHYAHDFAMQLLLRQATKCVSSVEQNLLRFTVGRRWGNTVASRDVLALLGLGGVTLGLINRVQLDQLQGQMNQVGHQVEALIGEHQILTKVTGALIDSQAKLHKTVATDEAKLTLTDSLAKMNTMVQTSCHVAGNLRNLLNDLRDHKFPGEFFDKVQMDGHFEDFKLHVAKAGLEPIFPSSAFLWNTEVQSMVKEEELSTLTGEEDAKAEAEADTVGVHVFQEVPDAAKPQDTITKVKVVLPKGTDEDAKQTFSHEDHDFENTLFTSSSKGMVLYILVTVPLKRQGEDGFTLYKLAPTLMSLGPNFSAVSEDSLKLHHPVPVQPLIEGGLLVPRMQSSGSQLVEVGEDFLKSCKLVEEVIYICSDTRAKPGPPCLTEVFHNQPHSPGCLGHYNILNPTHPHLYDTGRGQVQLFIPPKSTLYTICPGHVNHKIWKQTAGLYSVSLPKDCTLKVGGLRYTALTPYDLPGALTFSQDVKDLNQLMRIQEVVERENWESLKDLIQEQHSDEVTLRDLQKRLEENSLQKFNRKNPEALTYYSLAAAPVIILLLLGLGFMLFRYGKVSKEKYKAELSRLEHARDNYHSSDPRPSRMEVPERSAPLLPPPGQRAIEYQPGSTR